MPVASDSTQATQPPVPTEIKRRACPWVSMSYTIDIIIRIGEVGKKTSLTGSISSNTASGPNAASSLLCVVSLR